MGAKLVDQRSGQEHELRPDGATIGRHADNTISLPGRAISRFHAEIAAADDGWVIEDHGSSYGTFVNGRKVEGVVAIKDGDHIRLGVCTSAPEGEFNFVFRLSRGGVSELLRGAARAIVNRRKVDLGRMVFERNQQVLLVRLSGMFRRREVDALEAGILKELAGGLPVVALDLAGVQYMNSYGLACLVKLAAGLRDRQSRLRVFGAGGTVLKLLGLAGPGSPIEQAGSEQEAVRPAT